MAYLRAISRSTVTRTWPRITSLPVRSKVKWRAPPSCVRPAKTKDMSSPLPGPKLLRVGGGFRSRRSAFGWLIRSFHAAPFPFQAFGEFFLLFFLALLFFLTFLECLRSASRHKLLSEICPRGR